MAGADPPEWQYLSKLRCAENGNLTLTLQSLVQPRRLT